MSHDPSSAAVVLALETLWSRVRREHADVPSVVFTLGAGSDPRRPGSLTRGHWSPARWQPTTPGGQFVGEVFIAGERLADGAAGVLSTVLHEAAHGVAHVRGVKDTSRGGRYHNRRFARIAEALGLTVTQTGSIGWSGTAATPETVELYSHEVRLLEQAIRAVRRPYGADVDDNDDDDDDDDGDSENKPRKSRIKVACKCETPRALYVAPGVFDLGSIECSVCQGPFTEV